MVGFFVMKPMPECIRRCGQKGRREKAYGKASYWKRVNTYDHSVYGHNVDLEVSHISVFELLRM